MHSAENLPYPIDVVRRSLSPPKTRAANGIKVSEIFSAADAKSLQDYFATQAQWGLRLSDGQRHLGIPPTDYQELGSAELKEVQAIAYAAAAKGYAYLREEIWLPPFVESTRRLAEPPLVSLVRTLRGEEFATLLARETDARAVEVDSFAITRYCRGHFASFSERKSEDETFRFSISLTPRWNLSWGGLLQRRTDLGSVGPAFLPTFNELFLYPTSAPFGVSFVAPFAQSPAYYVTGDFRKISAVESKTA